MGWKTIAGTVALLLAAAGGCWWAVSASATPPSPVIGPALVVTPANGASPRPALPQARDGESPEAVDPRWVRPVDEDDRGEGAEVTGD